jgi:hypothetical protein
VAGTTGSGKSVCINSIIASLLFRYSPEQLRFIMIDPKVVEMQIYNSLPHLITPVVTDPKKVLLALRWVVKEMEKRYQIFARVNVRNIASFNSRPKDKPLPPSEPELPLIAKREKVEAGADGFAVEVDEQIVVPRDEDIIIPEKLSYIVVIVDELADLMLVAPADVEMAIARITQMARAACWAFAEACFELEPNRVYARLLSEPAMVSYLAYLQYWQRAEYARFLQYPAALAQLQLLQAPEYRAAMAAPEATEHVWRQQFYAWQHAGKALWAAQPPPWAGLPPPPPDAPPAQPPAQPPAAAVAS